jgi:hypothetical protein
LTDPETFVGILDVQDLGDYKVRGHAIRLFSLERNGLVGIRMRFVAIGFGGHIRVGDVTCSYMDHGVRPCLPISIRSRLRRGVSGTVSGFAVTSASSKNPVNLFIPSANQGFAILPNKREGRWLHSMGENTLYPKSVKIGFGLGDVELRGTSSNGMECGAASSLRPRPPSFTRPVKQDSAKWFTPVTEQRITSTSSAGSQSPDWVKILEGWRRS